MATEDLEQLRAVSLAMFGGWGQTRLVERANKEVGEQETFATSRKILELVQQLDYLRSRQVISLLDRPELDPLPQDTPSVAPSVKERRDRSSSHPSTTTNPPWTRRPSPKEGVGLRSPRKAALAWWQPQCASGTAWPTTLGMLPVSVGSATS